MTATRQALASSPALRSPKKAMRETPLSVSGVDANGRMKDSNRHVGPVKPQKLPGQRQNAPSFDIELHLKRNGIDAS